MSISETTPSRAPRWMKITLTLSLAANLAVVGLALGLALRGPMPRGGPDGILDLARALPGAHQRNMREGLREGGSRLREDLRLQRGLTTALAEALRATPFDIEAFRAVLAGQRARLGDIQATAHNALIQQIELMTDEERNDYAEALEHRRRH